MSTPCRLLAYEVADGPSHMALDDILLEVALREDVPFLRFYGWQSATLSLGYFQPSQTARLYPGLADLPWVRRPSGGAALVHQHELTYALALPPSFTRLDHSSNQMPWLLRVHRWIQAALHTLEVDSFLCQREHLYGQVLCFLHHTPGDLLLSSPAASPSLSPSVHKIVGSAQRKRRGALLQHGAILLAQSPHTPELPGIRELVGLSLSSQTLIQAFLDQIRQDLGWQLCPFSLSAEDRASLASRIASRYAHPCWNEKR